MQKGITLIELLVAVFILSVGVFAVITIFPFGAKLIRSSEMTAEAVMLAQEKIEESSAESYSDIAVGTFNEPSLLPPFENFSVEKKVSYVDPSSEMQEIAADKGIKKVEVTVSWSLLLGVLQNSVKLSALICQK